MPKKTKILEEEGIEESFDKEINKTSLGEIVKVAKDEVKDLIKDWLLVGRDVREKVYTTMKEMGYSNASELISDAVEFFREKESLINALEENRKLKRLLSLYRAAATPRLTKIAKLKTIKRILLMSKLMKLDPNTVKVFIEGINEV